MISTPRFKSPALIELTIDRPGLSSITLSRDIKVVDAFAFAHGVVDGANFRVEVMEAAGRSSVPLISDTLLVEDTIVRPTQLRSAMTMIRTGQHLSFILDGQATATICLWVIPQPK
jgi:hypothetical protein